MTRQEITDWLLSHGWELSKHGQLITEIRETSKYGFPLFRRYSVRFYLDRVEVWKENRSKDECPDVWMHRWDRVDKSKLVGVNVGEDGILRIGSVKLG